MFVNKQVLIDGGSKVIENSQLLIQLKNVVYRRGFGMLLKMKLTIVVLVLATCLTCEASVAIIPNDPDYSKYDNFYNIYVKTIFAAEGIGCYTKTYDLGEFETGETKRVPSQCAIAICNKNFIDYIG